MLFHCPECSELLAVFDNVLSISLWLRFMTAWYAVTRQTNQLESSAWLPNLPDA